MELKKHVNGFLENPLKILLFFIIVNLLPNIGLVFTEPYSVLGKVVLILFPIGLYCIMFSIIKNIGLTQLILIPLLIIHAFQIVVFYLFGEGVIAADMFLNLVTTSVSEAGEVLGGIFASVILVIIIYIPAIIIAAKAFKRKTYLTSILRKKLVVTGLILTLTGYLMCFAAKNLNTEKFSLREDVYPVDVFYNLKFAINKWKKSNQYLKTSKDFTFNAQKESDTSQREIYVLVIGETSRSENWSLYGYERETTPLLQKDSNIVFFKDAITQSNTTHKSVSIMLTASSAENYHSIYEQKSIIGAFKETGFSTAFISNQSANHTFTDYFAQEADYIKYFRFFNKKTNNLDEAMLPQLQYCIDSIDGDLFIILHTYGSHFNYKERYPQKFSKFVPDDITEVSRTSREILINAYDNSILYTDYFLAGIIRILEESDSNSFLFFSSDHGEDIKDDDRQKFLHSSPAPTYYQLAIPMLMWFSPVYKNNYPALVENVQNNKYKPVSTNAVFHTILDMARIKTDYLDTDLSLASQDFKVAKRMYLDDHDNPIFFHKAGLKKQDKLMIDKRNLFY